MQIMEKNNEVRTIVDMIVPGKGPRGRQRGRWMDCEGTSGGFPGQNILEIKNSGRLPHLVGPGEEDTCQLF